jgi:hypothetical protein
MNDKVKAFVVALRSSRLEHRWTQKQAGAKLGIARARYYELEYGRLPTRNLQPHYAFVLLGFSPTVATLFATAVGRPLEQLVVHVNAGPAMLDAKAARPVVLAAIYKAAEDHDVSPTTVRRVAADVFEQLADAGVSLQQALEITRAAVNESGKGAAKESSTKRA